MKTSLAVGLAPVGATTSQREASEAHATTRPSSADLKLLARLRAGDDSALSELVRRYQASLMRLAVAFLPNQALAEEAVQDTWIAVVDGLASFERRSSLKTWIFRILTNRAKTRLLREARSVPFSALSGDDSDEVAANAARFVGDGHWAESPRSFSDESPEKQLIDKEAISCLERALRQLPLNQRTVVSLRDVQGMESDEVCNILGIGETNQRVLLHRGRSKLRRAQKVEIYLHLRRCRDCRIYLDQMETTVRLLGRLPPPRSSAEVSDELLARFHGARLAAAPARVGGGTLHLVVADRATVGARAGSGDVDDLGNEIHNPLPLLDDLRGDWMGCGI